MDNLPGSTETRLSDARAATIWLPLRTSELKGKRTVGGLGLPGAVHTDSVEEQSVQF